MKAASRGRLLRQRLVAFRDQADPHVEADQPGVVEVMAENGEARGGGRPCRVNKHMIAGGSDPTTDHPASLAHFCDTA